MTASLRDLKAVAKIYGAKVEDDFEIEGAKGAHECRVEAPRGFIWMCDLIHELVDSANRPGKPDYEDLISRMEYGVEVCADPECEWCRDNEPEERK